MSSNIQILQDWVDGNNFRPTSINFLTDKVERDKKKNETPIGGIWEDEEGNQWKRMGPTAWSKEPKVLNILREIDADKCCKACNKTISQYSSRHDHKAHTSTGMCFDCMIELDTERRLNGTYKDYAAKFVLNKQKDYVEDMLSQLRESLESLGDKDVMEFVNEFGDVEKWSGLDVNKLREDIEKDIKEGEETLERINTSLSELNG